jgi:transcriptional regulator with GAF, ATPase, and Fis domain
MPSPDESVNQRIAELARIVHADESLECSLRRVADTALDVVNRCDVASVSMASNGQVTTWVSTDASGRRADEHQYSTDEGPCLEAIRTGQTLFVESLESDDRWPSFSERATAEGMVSIYSLPLSVGDEVVGALNLYSRSKPLAFPDQRAAEALAEQASFTLANSRAYHHAQGRLADLEEAPEDRDE